MTHENQDSRRGSGDPGSPVEKQEAIEDYDTLAFRHRMRVPSPLSPEAERVMTETIGAAIAVHRELGPGFLESIYRKAMCIELRARALAFECERRISVSYRDVVIDGQRVDLVVEGLIVVELKAVTRLEDVHRAQVISYLRTLKLRGGLLINFHVPYLRQGIRRVVL